MLFNSIVQSIDKDGLVARTHGNTAKSPKHTLTVQDLQNVKQFLVNYTNKYGLPLPGRLPNFGNEKALALPSDKKRQKFIRIMFKLLKNCNTQKYVCQNLNSYGYLHAK
jgi:hypothetical protein